MDHEERTPILKEPLSGYQDLALSARLKMFFTSLLKQHINWNFHYIFFIKTIVNETKLKIG